ncbi:MAG: 30S ribosomal protein S6 [Acidobacteriaceae bacterium]|jgi:small subunit ribosomal protein S6|nr:30S ribosomal protein S6 [Acidobacteriaceae bacterium]
MRTYEELFIVNTSATEEEQEAIVETLRGVITSGGGTLDKVEKWGVRKLAYRVNRQMEGIYILLEFSTQTAETAKEVERRLRVTDLVIKFITVRMDERMRRVEKRKKRREKRAARKPQITAPLAPVTPGVRPEMPAAPEMPMPAAPLPLEAGPASAEPAAEN